MAGANGVSRRVKALRVLLLASLLPFLCAFIPMPIGPMFGPADFGFFFGGDGAFKSEYLRDFSGPGEELAKMFMFGDSETPRSEAAVMIGEVCSFFWDGDDSNFTVYECPRTVALVKWYCVSFLPSVQPEAVELKTETDYRLAKYDDEGSLATFWLAEFDSLREHLPKPVFEWESAVREGLDLFRFRRCVRRSNSATGKRSSTWETFGCYFEWCPKSGERDFLKAYVWYEVAEENGYRSHDGRLAEAKGHLSAREISQADVPIQNWTPAQCEVDLRRYSAPGRARAASRETREASGAAETSR